MHPLASGRAAVRLFAQGAAMEGAAAGNGAVAVVVAGRDGREEGRNGEAGRLLVFDDIIWLFLVVEMIVAEDR